MLKGDVKCADFFFKYLLWIASRHSKGQQIWNACLFVKDKCIAPSSLTTFLSTSP